jgi:hypothetical protein
MSSRSLSSQTADPENEELCSSKTLVYYLPVEKLKHPKKLESS